MLTEFEIERAVSFVFLTFDWKITEDVRRYDNDRLGCNKIFSPYGKTYIENYGYDKYGTITPIEISVIHLNKMARCTNYVDLANNRTWNMHSPIDVAYYFHLCGVWSFLHTAESYTHHLDGTPNVNRSQFFSQQAKRYIRIAIDDIINYDLGDDPNEITSEDLSELIQREIILPLYTSGTFMDYCAATNDENINDFIKDGFGESDLSSDAINYPIPSIDTMNEITGEISHDEK